MNFKFWYKKEKQIGPSCTVSISMEREYSIGKEKESVLAADALIEDCIKLVTEKISSKFDTPKAAPAPKTAPTPPPAPKPESPAKTPKKRGRKKKTETPTEPKAPPEPEKPLVEAPPEPEKIIVEESEPAASPAELRKQILQNFALNTKEAKALLAEREKASQKQDTFNLNRINQEITKQFVTPFLQNTIGLNQAAFKKLDKKELQTLYTALTEQN